MSFCPSCGTRHAPGARFCEKCGTPAVAPPPAQQPAAEQPTGRQPAVQQPAASSPTGAQPTVQQPLLPTPSLAPGGAGSRGGNRRTVLASAGGVVAAGVLAAVGFFVYDAIAGASGGADSPEDAVLGLAAAATDEDPVTALSLLPPGEVGPLVDVYREVESKAADSGLVSSDAPLAGFDLAVADVAVEAEELGPGVAAVTITSGQVTWEFDPEQLQGPLQRDPGGEPRRATSGSEDLVEVSREATDGAPLRIMTVEQDGRWYVSPAYTLLEAWRVSEGLPAPDFSTDLDLESTGAESPRAAVEEAAYAAANYDVQGFLDLLSPEEAGAVYHYRDAIMTALNGEEDWADLRQDVQIGVERLDLVEGEERDGRVPVTVRSAAGSGVADDDYVSWTLDGNCVTISEDGDTETGCLDEVVDQGRIGRLVAAEVPRLTLLTSERDGRWYLNPLATLVTTARDAVGALEGDDVLTLFDVRQYGSVTGELESGTPVDGTIDVDTGDALYEIAATAGEALTFCMDEGDAYGTVFGPDGRRLYGDTVVPQEDGTYRVLVRGEPGGSYTLIGESSPIDELAVPGEVSAAGGGVSCGSRVVRFQAEADVPVLFQSDGGGVEVIAPDGEVTYDSLFVPTQSGEHYAVVDADADLSAGPVPAGVLVPGDIGSAMIDPATGEARFSVFLDSGTELSASSSGYDTIYLTVQDPSGYEVDFTSGYGGEAYLSTYVDQPGIYDVVVYGFDVAGVIELEVG